MQVRDIMTRNPACCTPDSSLSDVALKMKENDCGCIPVVDSMSGMKPVGTITDRDITIRTVAENYNPIDMKAADIMTGNIATVTPQSDIETCFDVMEEKEIRRVLVVDDQGKCCGIVAQADIVQLRTNPVRTNKVIREISESAPSKSRKVSRGGKRKFNSYSDQTPSVSSMSSSVLPLLIGVGSGVALMYWLNTKQKSSNYSNYNQSLNSISSESDYLNATNQESFGKYVDAEQEIENEQSNAGDKVQAIRAGSNLQSGDILELPKTDESQMNASETKEKGRTAHQG